MHCSTKSPLLPVNSSIYTKDREVGRGKIIKIATDLVLGNNIIAAVIFSWITGKLLFWKHFYQTILDSDISFQQWKVQQSAG